MYRSSTAPLAHSTVIDPSKKSGKEATWLLHAAIVVTILLVAVLDVFTPLGVAVWVLYLVPVTISLWVWRPAVPLIVALAATIFMIVMFFTSAPGMDRNFAQLNRGFGLFTIWATAAVGYFFILNKIAVRKQQWLQFGENGLNEVMGGEQRLEELGENVLRFLSEFTHAHAGAFFAREGVDFRRIAT